MCDGHFKDINPNMKIKETTTSDKVSAVASDDRVMTPADWEQETKIQIMDPDGWRSKHANLEPKNYREPITKEEFMARATWSTCMGL